jgi:AP-1 complex subunit mu
LRVLLVTDFVVIGGFGGSMGGVGGTGKAKRPIGVKFEIPYFTTSGIQVRYLKIIEPKVNHCNTPPKFHTLTLGIVAIPIPAMGQIHHTERRHCGAVT